MIEAILKKVEQELPFLESLAVGKLIESTRYPKENRKAFKVGQYSKEILASFPFWRQCDEPVLIQRLVYLPEHIDSIHVTRDTRDVMSVHSSLTKPTQEYVAPLDRSTLKEGQCRNTGLWTHEYYKNNKKMPDRKKADLCKCSACIKLREARKMEISEYRAGLRERKNRKKKDPLRYR